MELSMKELLSIVTLFMGATGFWKIIEILVLRRYEKKKKTLEISDLKVQTNNVIVQNWIEWSSKLENRIKVLESYLDEVKSQNRDLVLKINALKLEIQELKEENKSLLEIRESQAQKIKELEEKVAVLKNNHP